MRRHAGRRSSLLAAAHQRRIAASPHLVQAPQVSFRLFDEMGTGNRGPICAPSSSFPPLEPRGPQSPPGVCSTPTPKAPKAPKAPQRGAVISLSLSLSSLRGSLEELAEPPAFVNKACVVCFQDTRPVTLGQCEAVSSARDGTGRCGHCQSHAAPVAPGSRYIACL